MRWKAVALVILCLILVGCSDSDSPVDDAISVRNRLQQANGCSFVTTVTADYGKEIYQFTVDCQGDREGNVFFTVRSPETIKGISGKITGQGGAITFDDTVLAFQMIADGQITPVSAPWLLVKTLRGGYLNACARTDAGLQISIDDSYAEEALRLEIIVKDEIPVSAEVFWKGRRVLTLLVENFTYL